MSDVPDFMKRPVVRRGLGGLSIVAVQKDAVVVSPALQDAAARAVTETVDRTKIFANAGRWGILQGVAHDAALPAPMTTPTEPAPGAVNATNTANAGTASKTPTSAKGLTGGGIAEQIRRLPPIVAEPLKWAPAIGLGLYLLGHEKAGVVVAAAGVARYLVVNKRR